MAFRMVWKRYGLGVTTYCQHLAVEGLSYGKTCRGDVAAGIDYSVGRVRPQGESRHRRQAGCLLATNSGGQQGRTFLIHLTPRSSLIGHPARKSYMRPHRVGVIPFGVSFVVLQSSVLL